MHTYTYLGTVSCYPCPRSNSIVNYCPNSLIYKFIQINEYASVVGKFK